MDEKLYRYVDAIYSRVVNMFSYTINGRGIRAYIGMKIQAVYNSMGADKTLVERAVETNLLLFKIVYERGSDVKRNNHSLDCIYNCIIGRSLRP